MSISAHEMALYRRTARQRAQTAAAGTERRARAWEAARRAAAWVRVKFPDAQLRVFGSLLYPDAFGAASDIDLAVEGVTWPDYLRLWSELERREPEFRIDLVDLAIVSAGLRTHVEREGVAV